ncbi:MAG: chloramphenicol O-acetyltransferase [Paraglaciecola sp.]|jgi:chloramphenicol O-acetyltransferase
MQKINISTWNRKEHFELYTTFKQLFLCSKKSEHDSTPTRVMGKYKNNHNEIAMSVSVEVHHALVDGLHVGQYFDKLQLNFNHFFDRH